ncbi:hypothetical protein JD969_00780 [Planctomycetota bacterium]|nr:hypothetical protein JD969_00780 [Planctomycetota bacterium]
MVNNDENKQVNKYVRLPLGDENWSNPHIESLVHDYEGFRVLLKMDTPYCVVRIGYNFDWPDLHRCSETSHRIKTIDRWGDRVGYGLYEVQQSTFIAWAQAESYGVYQDREWKHYALIAQNKCVDIIFQASPGDSSHPKINFIGEYNEEKS